jgi:hypothetical protein
MIARPYSLRSTRRPRFAAWLLGMSCCATLGGTGGNDLGLPSSGVGPFRKLVAAEVLGIPPYVLDNQAPAYREPAVLPVNPTDTSSADVFLFAVATQGIGAAAADVIVRTRADDGRSFYGTSLDYGHTPLVVLTPSAAWEGANLAGPSAVIIGGETLLYYAGMGGIGLARSSDGQTFQKVPTPVLTQDPSVAWETTPPTAPSVAVYPDGQIRMLYAAGVSIGEASSPDGVTWQRLDADPTTPAIDPVLSPSPAPAQGTLEDGQAPPFDTGQVGDPCLAPRMTAAGRVQVRVLYTGYATPPSTGGAVRETAIGFAARYGDSGPLVREPAPVFSAGLHEAAPALFEWTPNSGSMRGAIPASMLYIHMDETTGAPVYPAIAGAVAPADFNLSTPAPNSYATSP